MMFKLLIIDDEEETRDALCKYFPWKDVGFSVVGQFDNGQEALDYLVDHPVHVVLTDIRMPVMSGIDLAKELHQNGNKAKVIFLSAYNDFDYAKQALVYGVKDYILKPSRYEELVEVFTRMKHHLELDAKQNHLEPQNDQVLEGYDYEAEVILKIKQYVALHYKDATLEDAATLVKMNSSYLSYFFKQKTGENFSNYLLSVRMQKAAELLKDIHTKVYDVSEQVGYTNPKNFTRTFKHYFGQTPMEFRRGVHHENK